MNTFCRSLIVIFTLFIAGCTLAADYQIRSSNETTEVEPTAVTFPEDGFEFDLDVEQVMLDKSSTQTPIVPTPTAISEAEMLDSELWWLARGMEEEDGVEWNNEDILKIGTVIANRKDDPRFPNTYKEVLLQEGQYQPFFGYASGDYELKKPDDRYIYLAELIMGGYRSWNDPSVIWQACFFQGTEIVATVYDPYLGSTTYFCR